MMFKQKNNHDTFTQHFLLLSASRPCHTCFQPKTRDQNICSGLIIDT